MNALTYVLWGLFDLWMHAPLVVDDQSNRPTLFIQDIDILLHRLMVAVAPDQVTLFLARNEAAQIAQPDNPTRTRDIDGAEQLLRAAERVLRAAPLDESALRRIQQIVRDLLFLRTAIGQSNFAQSSLAIEKPDFFEFVRELRFHSALRHEQIAIIGMFDAETQQVEQFSKPSILQSIDLFFQKHDSEIILNFRNLQSRRSEENAQFIPRRHQRPQKNEDLFVYKPYNNQLQLRIETRSQSDVEFDIGNVHLIISGGKHIKAAITTFHDMSRNPNLLSKYVRIIRA